MARYLAVGMDKKMAPSPQISPAQREAMLVNANAQARQLVIAQAAPMFQQVFQTTVATPGSTSNVVNISPRYAGLLLGFVVRVSGTLTNNNSGGGAAAITPTGLGPANFLSQIQLYDLNNNQRHNSPGWHFHMINSAKRNRPFAAPRTNTSYPIAWGNTLSTMMVAPSTIASTASGTVSTYYYVPVAYSEMDTRGAIYINVVNATMNLQLTINPNPSIASGDATLAMYSGNGGDLTNVTITCYQHYLDQLPAAIPGSDLVKMGMTSGGVILPMLDLQKSYMLQNTTLSGLTASLDFPVQYANFRDFFSTCLIYDNGGTLNAGTDVNYFAIQSANYTNLFKADPITAGLLTRNMLGDDPPAGVYYFDHRRKVISSIQYGNMEFIVNPSTVNSNAALLMGYEMMTRQGVIMSAGSLPGG